MERINLGIKDFLDLFYKGNSPEMKKRGYNVISSDLSTTKVLNDPSHIGPYTPKTIELLIKMCGFKPISNGGRFGLFYIDGEGNER